MASNFSIGLSVDTQKAEANIKQAAESFKKLDKSIDEANKELGNFDGITDKAVVNAKKQYRSLVKQINDVSLTLASMSKTEKESASGQALQKKLAEMEQQAAKFSDALSDNQQKIKNLASDTQVTDGLNMLARTFGDVTTAVNVLGGDSENLKKILYDVAKIQATVRAVESLTKAFQKQNLVLLKNPYVMVGAGIAALALAIGNYKGKTDEATTSTNKLNESFTNLVDTLSKDLGLTFGEGLSGEKLDRYVIAQSKLETAHKKWLESLKKEYSLQQYVKDERAGAIQELEKQKEKTAQYRKEWQEAGEALKEFQTVQQTTHTTTKTAVKAQKDYNEQLREALQLEKEIGELGNLGYGIHDFLPNESAAGAPKGVTALLLGDTDDSTITKPFMERIAKLGAEAKKAFEQGMKDGKSPLAALLSAENLQEGLTNLKTVQQTVKGVASAASTAAGMFTTLGSAMKAPALNIMGMVAQAVANVALAYGEALAKDGSTKNNIFGFIAAAAASMVSMMTTIATIKNAAQFASGGIVGSTSVGDFNLARVNNREMILNGHQQENLFRILQGQDSIHASSINGGNVEFKIKGQELVGVLNNYSNIKKKIR